MSDGGYDAAVEDAGTSGMSHALVAKWWPAPAVGVVEARITYTRLDGSTVTLPVTTIYRLRGDLAADVRLYMDINPLYATG